MLKEKGLIREIRATMLNRVVPLSLKAFQTTDETFCKGQSYILNPTFIVAQRNDGTVIGLASTGVYT